MRTVFPTRQIQANRAAATGNASRSALTNSGATLAIDEQSPSNLFRSVIGLDERPTAMPDVEVQALGDRFSGDILLKGGNPLTLRALAEAIENLADPALPIRRMFLVAEGAQAVAAGHDFALNARLVFTWQASDAKPPDLLLSTVAAADDPRALLQIIGWSELDGAFHFFERRDGVWLWAGNSFHALSPPSRGLGPFDSHVNGGLVMKELKAPWIHWHSQSAAIPRDVFGPASEFNTDPLFAQLDGAQRLEGIVRAGIRRWTASRLSANLTEGVMTCLPDCLRQILWCTSINLVSSNDGFGSAEAAFDLPRSFFFDVDAIAAMAQLLAPDLNVVPSGQLTVDAAMYRAAVAEREIGMVEDAPAKRRIGGDAHFAFVVPERAFEDFAVLRELVARLVLSPRLALTLLLVDFSNPLFSPARASLLRHVPPEIAAGDGGAALDTAFVATVRAADQGGAEREFLTLWEGPDIAARAAELLADYQAALAARLKTAAGVADLLALAESRRSVVRLTRSLNEFRSTLPEGTDPPQHLAMAPDATIFTKQSSIGEGEN